MIQQLTNSSLDRVAVRETRIPANIYLNRNIVLNKYSFLTLSLRRRHLAVSRTTFVLDILGLLPLVFRRKDQIH